MKTSFLVNMVGGPQKRLLPFPGLSGVAGRWQRMLLFSHCHWIFWIWIGQSMFGLVRAGLSHIPVPEYAVSHNQSQHIKTVHESRMFLACPLNLNLLSFLVRSCSQHRKW